MILTSVMCTSSRSLTGVEVIDKAHWCGKGEAKERFNEIKQELSQISTKFSNNLLDATKAFKKLVTDKADVDGLPASALALGAQQVRPGTFSCCQS